MADDREPYPMDTKVHEKTYSNFLALAKWGTIVALIVTAVIVVILVD